MAANIWICLSGIGVAGIGHAHPAVIQAVQDQAARYLHTMVYGEYIQANLKSRLARRLAEITPDPLSVTYFTNSGTEAVEGALKTARKYTAPFASGQLYWQLPWRYLWICLSWWQSCLPHAI